MNRFYRYIFLCLAILSAFLSSLALADNSAQLLKLLPNLKTGPQAESAQAQPQNSATAPQPNSSNSVQTRLWNLNNADIRDIIQEVSRETGKNFVIDPRVQGKVTLISSTPMNAQGIYQVLLSTLQVLGYAAIPRGQVVKIIPDSEAVQHASSLATSLHPGIDDEYVVRVIPVHNGSADQMVPVLRPLLPQTATISSNISSNSLIIAGRAANVERLAEVVAKVDTTNVNGVDVIPLNYALAQDVVNSIQQLFANNKSYNSPQLQISVSVDDRSNSVLLSGNQHDRLKLKVLISQLDTPSEQTGNTQVIYLHYLKSQDLVPILAGIAQSYYRGPVGTVIGTRTPTGIDYAANADEESNAGGSFGSTSSTSSIASSVSNPASTTPGASGLSTLPNLMSGVNQSSTTASDTGQKPKVEIIAEPNTNSIILNAPPTLLRTLKMVINKLDVKPAQILVEALIAEVDRNTSAELGIQWGALTQPGQTGITESDLQAGFRAGIGIITGQGIHNLQGVIRAIGQDQDSNILSTPSVVVLDNHQAKIIVGQEVSIQSSSYPNNAGGTTGATPFTTFDRRKVALHLYVTPQIDQGKTLMLAIDQGNDTLQNSQSSTTIPVFNISSIKTSVLVNSGDILVLGGLTQNQNSRGNQNLPLLGDIPGIGNIFKVNNHSKNKKQLLVFIRPIILYDSNQGIQISNGKYDAVRNEQLNWFRKTYFKPDYKEFVFPPYKKPADLPTPFDSTS